MQPYHSDTRGRPVARLRRLPAVLLALLLAASTACDSLLTVDNPGRVPVDDLNDPALLPTLEAAAIQTFQCGFVAFAATGGMLAGEYVSANAFVNNHIWERRNDPDIKNEPGNCTAVTRTSTFLGFYTPLQQARYQLDDLAARASAFTVAQVPARQRLLIEARAYGGYAYALLGEGMCTMAIDGGPSISSDSVLKIAESRFSEAIDLATAANETSLRDMARVGRARVRLDLGDLAGAAADAALVPTGFVRTAEFSDATQARENRIYNLTIRNDYMAVDSAYYDLKVNDTAIPGQTDPRVPVENMNRKGSDNTTWIWRQRKFSSGPDVKMPIASWAEAQLILAEATGGQAGIDAINRVRAANSVPAVVWDPTADITPLVLEERRRQLFSEGQRYVDMLRHDLPFKTGLNQRKSQTFGTVTCVPLPNVETQNNPNFKG